MKEQRKNWKNGAMEYWNVGENRKEIQERRSDGMKRKKNKNIE